MTGEWQEPYAGAMRLIALLLLVACAPPDGVAPGRELRTTQQAIAGLTTDDLDRAVTIARAKTAEALAPLLLARKVTLLDEGTAVRVIQTSWGNAEIRVLAGPRSGEHWWIDRQCLR